MLYKINITPMSLKNGVLGLPINCCREWEADTGIEGNLTFKGITDKITITPKHIFVKDIDKNSKKLIAHAWQFTVNNSIQFGQLKLSAVNTYVEQKMIGEHLLCDVNIYNHNGKQFVSILVKDVITTIQTKYSNTVRSLLEQGIRTSNLVKEPIISWSRPSEWINMNFVENYANIHNCLYIWYGIDSNNINCIYVGIVGDLRGDKRIQGGQSKRTLAKRLKEEERQFLLQGIKICKFRYCNLQNCPNKIDASELLKTIEMAIITSISSLISCDGAQSEIIPLFNDKSIRLLNKMTSYRFIK